MDPIGLAEGLNAYGFAGGDPVNFSDPFGLSCAVYGNCTQSDQGGNQSSTNQQIVGEVGETAKKALGVVKTTSIYVRGGMGMLTTQAELRGDGKWSVKTGPIVGTSAISAVFGARHSVQAAPENGVELEGSKQVGKIGPMAVSVTGRGRNLKRSKFDVSWSRGRLGSRRD